MVSTTRDLPRNFAAAKWALNKHLDYVSSFHFQSRTGDVALDKRLENLFDWWSNPRNCDISGRHDFARLIRILESNATVDGDVWIIKLASGEIQVVEGDRVRTPTEIGNNIPIPEGGQCINGAVVDAYGKLVGICLCSRQSNKFGLTAGGFTFDRFVSADNLIQHGYFSRYDQVRGISPFASGLNSFRDVMEANEYALIKAKIVSLVGLKVMRSDGAEQFQPSTYGNGNEEGVSQQGYNVDFGQAPYVLDLNPGDNAEIMESQHPSTQFQEYMKMMLSVALKSLDIPFSFFDEAYTNWSGMRQAWCAYNQSAEIKRNNLRRVLNDIMFWKVASWIASGLITLPPGMTIYDVRWEFVGTGVPWLNPLQEVNADIAAINAGLTSRQRICKERGDDFYEIVAELGTEQKLIVEQGLNPIATPVPIIIDGKQNNE